MSLAALKDLYLCTKRELHATMSLMEVLRKPLRTDIVIAAHAKHENHYAILVRN